MLVGVSQSANAGTVISSGFIDSLGREWADPFGADLLEKDYDGHVTAFIGSGWIFATKAVIDATLTADFGGTNDAGMDAFVAALGYQLFSDADNAGSVNFRDIRAADGGGSMDGDTFGAYDSNVNNLWNYYTYISTFENYAAFGYRLVQTPEARALGIFGTALMFMGYMAFRGRKA